MKRLLIFTGCLASIAVVAAAVVLGIMLLTPKETKHDENMDSSDEAINPDNA
jgi:hypothetical protein